VARLKNTYKFLANMHVDGATYSNRYSITIDFVTGYESLYDQNIALDRIAYFFTEVVQSCTFIQEDLVDQINLLVAADLTVLTVPGPGAYDPVVLAALVTKINTMLDDVFTITEAELSSELTGPLVYVWDANSDDEIHTIVNADDDTRWWAAPEPRFASYPKNTNVTLFEKGTPFPISWETLGLEWEDEEDGDDAETNGDDVQEDSVTVHKADFKPKLKK
jgi:hypothetical protein